jgi:hypothetical protein
MITLVTTYHAWFERAEVLVIALGLTVLGCVFGALAGCWNWAVRHFKAFLSASFLAAMTMLLPFLVITYGYALLAFPLVLLWIGMNFAGLQLTKRLKTAAQR